jgi:beta-phosphoglucomutase
MNINPKKAYLFDMDGVLVNNCHDHVLAWLEFAKRRGGRLTEAEVIAWMGAPARDYLVRMFDAPLTEAQIAAFTREKEAIYREIYRPHLAPSAGLIPFLERARAAGVACAITTGGSMDNVDFVLDGLGIRGFFSCIVDSSRYAHGKPAPDCYLQTAAALGVAPADCRVFEDAINGIEAAQAAGMEVYALVGTNTREALAAANPTRVFASFDEL